MTTTNQEIFYCKSKGLKIPIRFDIFKHGGGIYLALVNQAEGVHLPLISTGPAMVAELRRVADAIERAVAGNEQAVIGKGNGAAPAPVAPPAEPARRPVLADLNGDPRHDWPIFVKRFHGGSAADVLPAIAHYYKSKHQYSAPDIDAILEATERLDLDFEQVRPELADILDSSGRLRRGARARVAEALGVRDAGNYRGRIDAVLGFILENSVELLESNTPKGVNSNDSNAEIEPVIYPKRQARAL